MAYGKSTKKLSASSMKSSKTPMKKKPKGKKK